MRRNTATIYLRQLKDVPHRYELGTFERLISISKADTFTFENNYKFNSSIKVIPAIKAIKYELNESIDVQLRYILDLKYKFDSFIKVYDLEFNTIFHSVMYGKCC